MIEPAVFSCPDFTEAHYRELLSAAAAGYRFITFPEFEQPGSVCLWRHDIDFSPHRAKRLATLEAECGVVATYFVNVHSEFYNALDQTSVRLVRDILAMEHRLGVHFDAAFYADQGWRPDDADVALARERELLESAFGTEVRCYSLHNPGVAAGWDGHEAVRAGMVNAYGEGIRSQFTYVSDSNGIWRHRRLADVIAEAPPRLHVLTHPGWWTPAPMSPRERISRCIDGRARAVHEAYDQFLAEHARPNVGRHSA